MHGAFFMAKGVSEMRKVCPKCGRVYYELDNYCTKCGFALEKEPNKCSEQRTTLCAHRVFEDDDIYCSYCGALGC